MWGIVLLLGSDLYANQTLSWFLGQTTGPRDQVSEMSLGTVTERNHGAGKPPQSCSSSV